MTPSTADRSSATAVILTALALEYEAVRAFLTDVEELEHRLGTIYEVGSFAGASHDWQIAIAEVGQGNSLAGIAVERAVTYFQPEVVLFVGVAGGLKDAAIGDVVAAEAVYGYESGKEDRTFGARIKTHYSARRLVERARSVCRSGSWVSRLAERSTPTPRALVGSIAAGEKVLASTTSETFERIRAQCGDALAVEMEGWGFLQGAYASDGVQALVVRGISDLVGDKDASSDLIRQPSAARHAAAFAFELLSQFYLPVGSRFRRPEVVPTSLQPSSQGSGGRSELLARGHSLAAEPSVQTYATQEESYEHAMSVIEAGFESELTNRSLSLVALHGPAGDRIAERDSAEEPGLQRFDALLERCIFDEAGGAWHVRAVYNVTNADRLEMILRYLRRWRSARRCEVRAFSVPEAIPLMSPLIVNGYDVLLGVEDRIYYRTGKCIHITGRAAASVAAEYFESLWHDSRIFKLRTLGGTDVREVMRLAEQLKVTPDVARLV